MTHPFDADLYDVYPDHFEKEVWANTDPLSVIDDPPEGELHTSRVHRIPGATFGRMWVANCIDCSATSGPRWKLGAVEWADNHGYYSIIGETA